MGDRFMNGFVAGLIADLPAILIDGLAGLLRLDKLNLIHFVSILAYEGKKLSFWETVFTTAIQLLFAGILGVVFAYLLPLIKKEYYYAKAVIYAVSIWFFIYAIDVVFKIHDVAKPDFPTSLVHSNVALIWGLGMAWILQRLEKNTVIYE